MCLMVAGNTAQRPQLSPDKTQTHSINKPLGIPSVNVKAAQATVSPPEMHHMVTCERSTHGQTN
ncbi:hypothetical protein DPMN_140277 [Dreissena polymorpha]|uniref:Uncharacterized protein n=1 Tax=Dreissena polymorpha TaxID=45954 RepID=A0A9D4G7D4_DREPO|nr:hypothetical protein DPMN_140277 [Dreissena polymorpha]